jgi:putative sugar O-methyltransferase
MIKLFITSTLGKFGYRLIRESTYKSLLPLSSTADKSVEFRSEPEKIEAPDSSEFVIDFEKYARLLKYYIEHPVNQIQGSGWRFVADPILTQGDISVGNFRGDNDYVWQSRQFSKDQILLSYVYVALNDNHGILTKFSEDGAFGAEVTPFMGRNWTRDLSDSVLEISFLLDELGYDFLNQARILDIGAGYGRLAIRMTDFFPNSQLFCTDGIAFSSIISEAYIRYRKAQDRVKVLTLEEIDHTIRSYDLAINIHSFSEMDLTAVEWWLSYAALSEIKYLFIVPNPEGLELNDGTSLLPLFGKYNYKVIKKRKKYNNEYMAENAPYSSTYYLLARA